VADRVVVPVLGGEDVAEVGEGVRLADPVRGVPQQRQGTTEMFGRLGMITQLVDDQPQIGQYPGLLDPVGELLVERAGTQRRAVEWFSWVRRLR
jgi:hypothetical protein